MMSSDRQSSGVPAFRRNALNGASDQLPGGPPEGLRGIAFEFAGRNAATAVGRMRRKRVSAIRRFRLPSAGPDGFLLEYTA